ncbi:MAG TPA: hypothetical protein V6C86_27050 [Oculatellaceae cyanobacterium]
MGKILKRSVAAAVLCLLFSALSSDATTILKGHKKISRAVKNASVSPILTVHSDPLAPEMSAEALQLADLMGIKDKLKRLSELNKLAKSSNLSIDQKEERWDLKFTLLETIEETRLQIDCVRGEIEEEEVVLEEARRLLGEERDDKVNRANINAFRTNGALWAVAEALDIPTYNRPKYSIPSGSIGIIAGIVPSIFSAVATRSSTGGTYKRQIYPNMLTKIFDVTPIPRVDYPGVVWLYLNTAAPGETKSRKQIIQERWRKDPYINYFRHNTSSESIMLLTGNAPYTGDLELVSDKLIMMGQVKAITLQMTRPLLEICMVVHDSKQMPENTPTP